MKKIAKFLTFLGSLPFCFCAALLFFGIEKVPYFGEVELILSAYGLVIASFMAGSHWGQALMVQGRWRCYLPILSNVIAVFLWLGFLTLPFSILLIWLILNFLILLLIDWCLFKDSLIEGNYFYVRFLVTLIVVVSLFISLIFK